MTQHLYLGTTEFVLHSPMELLLQQWDTKFLNPVLPTARRVDVTLTVTDELPIPSTEPFSIHGADAWLTPEGEYRLYKNREGIPPWILSRRIGADRVEILVRRPEWERGKFAFRPWFHIHLEQLLLDSRAIVLHSASIIYRHTAILFTAPSGTGKTTQTELWYKYAGGVKDLNGDRTLLQWTQDGWQACGFPASGSTVRCEQAAAPLGAIVIVRQAAEDQIQELSYFEKVTLLYSETTVSTIHREDVDAAMDLLEDLAAKVRILRLDCTMTENAVTTLHHYLFGD